MTNLPEWLRAHAYGSLSSSDHDAISKFLFLWSLFEAKVLNTNANADELEKKAMQWESKGRLTIEPFQSYLSYSQSRYFSEGNFTAFFDKLHLGPKNKRELVQSVIRGEKTTLGEIVGALLIIVYRLRNNLFHGVKWVDGFHDESDNFGHANKLLMTVMDLEGIIDEPGSKA